MALLQGAALLLAVACGSEGSEPSGGGAAAAEPVPPANLAATCGQGWVELCEAAECDPKSAAWTECRVNGWEGYATPASCPLETGHDGDDRVPCAPDPESGFQLHFGPEDPSDATAVARHQVQPGESTIECVYLPLPNAETRYLGQLLGRTRPGVHHTQLRFVDRAATTSSESEPCLPFGGEYVHMGQTREFQVPDLTVPNPAPTTPTAGGLDLAGGALELTPGRVLALELHYINGGDAPLLREGWIDFFYQPPERVERVLRGLMLIGAGIRVEPRSTGVVRRACESDRPRTITH
ncbi:MAG: hypothetical protein FJ104_12165, partial [Deltaproteobacteria bacterium]|nr:hypothetical protein [Deltaproteobacteria bacterium]